MTTKIFERPKALTDVVTHYCPGCDHGVVHRLVAEVMDELGIKEKTIGVASVGCSVLAYNYFNCDFVQAPHGRAPAVATGIRRTRPDLAVFTYQGDGDLASIGGNEIMHAANRGENITVIFYNNAIYGMTGGQMSPTTLPGMKTATSPGGRDVAHTGYPLRITEMLALCQGAAYIARTSCHDVANVTKTKRAIKKAFEMQLAGKGFSMVEVLGTCPTNWGISPVESHDWVKEQMMPVYPLGVFKEVE